MKQLEKEIAETNKQSMMKCYQLYGTKVSKLAKQITEEYRERREKSNGI